MTTPKERLAEDLASLAAEAEAIEAAADEAAEVDSHEAGTEFSGRGEQPKPNPARRRREEVSQVYSLRIPADRLEQLRALASARRIAPTALMRNWVLDRLDEEEAGKKKATRADGVEALAAGLAALAKKMSEVMAAYIDLSRNTGFPRGGSDPEPATEVARPALSMSYDTKIGDDYWGRPAALPSPEPAGWLARYRYGD